MSEIKDQFKGNSDVIQTEEAPDEINKNLADLPELHLSRCKIKEIPKEIANNPLIISRALEISKEVLN